MAVAGIAVLSFGEDEKKGRLRVRVCVCVFVSRMGGKGFLFSSQRIMGVAMRAWMLWELTRLVRY